MLTRILYNSKELTNFIDQLKIDLYKPQQQHILNMADALLVCEDGSAKTLAALQRQFVEAPDVSNMADFLRISPWDCEQVRSALRHHQLKWLLEKAEQTGAARRIYINIDDSIGEKDKQTYHIDVVDWHFDHAESGKGRPRYKKGFCYIACTIRIGQNVATVDLRLYLREKTVRRLNRHRRKEKRIAFRSKPSLTRQILSDLAPILPKGWTIYVQFDSWYASKRLIKYARGQGWHVTCALKRNRNLNGKRIDKHAQELRHRWYTKVSVITADGNKNTYYLRRLDGRLANVPYDVRVYFSKRHPRAKSLAYICCTDLTCSAKDTLQGYTWRWSCEVVNFYLKTQLGLADFRVRSYEAVDKYMVVVQLAWAYIEQRFAVSKSAQVKTYGDIIRQHRQEHAVEWLTGALSMAVELGDVEPVLERFLR